MIYYCTACRYLFEGTEGEERCVDCGKLRIRPAQGMEVNEYWGYQREFHRERWMRRFMGAQGALTGV